MPKRIQRQRTKGWRAPEGAVYVGRGSKWGNPYEVMPVGGHWTIIDAGEVRKFGLTRDEAVKLVCSWYCEAIPNGWNGVPDGDEIRAELAGKDLMCWCPLDAACHADVLLEIANGDTDDN